LRGLEVLVGLAPHKGLRHKQLARGLIGWVMG